MKKWLFLSSYISKKKEGQNNEQSSSSLLEQHRHTETMANEVAEGAKAAGAEVSVMTPDDFSADKMDEYDAIAFGCPAMGAEELEETEFEPMFSACISRLGGKKIALFGSYGWGDGEWMRTWEENCKNEGAVLTHESVICQEEPDDDAKAACQELGKSLA